MRILTYTVHIKPVEEGSYDVFVPAYEEAVAMAQEAIEGFVEALVGELR